MSVNQRIILVPQAGYPVSQSGCCDTLMIKEAELLQDIAHGDPKVIGVFPFIWQSFNDGQNTWDGLRELPNLKPTFNSIGTAITEQWSYPGVVRPQYRFFGNGGWFITPDVTEGIDASQPNNFRFDGVGFTTFSFSANPEGKRPLYRCHTPSSHFLSLSSDCESFTVDGIIGLVQQTQISGTIPLYRFVNTQTNSHLATTNYYEGIVFGLQYEHTLGYVPDAPLAPPGC